MPSDEPIAPASALTIVDPARDDTLWEAYIACRVRNLYDPFGLPASCADNDLDRPRDREGVWHRAATISGDPLRVVGVGRIDWQPNRAEGPSVQLRYFATDETVRGRGVGRLLMEEFERTARSAGAARLWMEARDTAVPFYLRLGYEDFGVGPTKWDLIPHRLLHKALA